MTAVKEQAPPAPPPARSPWPSRVIGLVVVVVLGAAVVGVALLLGVWAHVPGVLKATPSGPAEVTLNLATYPDSMIGTHGRNGGPHPDWVTYGPSTTLSVPAHSLVKVTIRNYDTATTLNDPYFATVQGTVGGVAYYNGNPLRRLSPEQVAHTFTIHMFPTSGQPGLTVNVPLAGVAENAKNLANGYPAPETVTFEFRTGAPGRYIWQCSDPCGGTEYFAGMGGPMSTEGYMTGTLTVGGASA